MLKAKSQLNVKIQIQVQQDQIQRYLEVGLVQADLVVASADGVAAGFLPI